MFDLHDTIAVVTGAGRGNGFAIASGLSKAGANVLGVDLSFPCETKFEKICGDVSSKEVVEQAVKYVSSQNQSHLSLVNNAGISLPSEGKYPEEYWRKTLEINLTAPFIWIEHFLPQFKMLKSGSIINITSLGAELAFPNNPSYLASKGGLKMLTKYYAKSLGKYGVRANNIGPGYLVTEMTKASYDQPKLRASRENHTFLGRWGQSEDLVGTAIYLASSSSCYVTGQDIYVDGGWTANGLVE